MKPGQGTRLHTVQHSQRPVKGEFPRCKVHPLPKSPYTIHLSVMEVEQGITRGSEKIVIVARDEQVACGVWDLEEVGVELVHA